MLLDYDLYKWLVQHKIIPRAEKPHVRADGRVELDEFTNKIIQNGVIFIKLVKILKKQNE